MIARVTMTCISREIQFHTSGVNCPNHVWKKLNHLFHKIDGIQVRYIKKYHIYESSLF